MNAWCGYVKNVTQREVDQWPLFKWHDRTKLSYCQTKAGGAEGWPLHLRIQSRHWTTSLTHLRPLVPQAGINVAHYFNVGVHPTGPFFENNVNNYTVRCGGQAARRPGGQRASCSAAASVRAAALTSGGCVSSG